MQITQLGLCTFTWTGTEYIAKPLAVYVLPEEPAFMVSPSAVRFLSKNSFDFNKWAQGVGYMTAEAEAAARLKARMTSLCSTLKVNTAAKVRKGWDIDFLYNHAYVPLAAALRGDAPAEDCGWEAVLTQGASVSVPLHDWLEEAKVGAAPASPDEEVTVTDIPSIRLAKAFDSFPRKLLRDLVAAGSWAAWAQAAEAEAAWEELQEIRAAAAEEKGEEAPPRLSLAEAFPDLGADFTGYTVDYLPEDQDAPGANRWRKIVRVHHLTAPTVALPAPPAWLCPHMPADLPPVLQAWKWWLAVRGSDAGQKRVTASAGVRLLWDALAASGKPVVGHNCLLDLLHITQAFAGRVHKHPHAWASQQLLRQLTPGGVYDTKHVWLWLSDALQAASEAGDQPGTAAARAALERVVGRGGTGLSTLYTKVQGLHTPSPPPDSAPEGEAATPAALDKHERALTAAANAAALVEHLPTVSMRVMETLKQQEAKVATEEVQEGGEAASGEGALQAQAEEWAHDAGYDAYMTGAIFAHVRHLVKELLGPGQSMDETKNTLHIMWSKHATQWDVSTGEGWYLEDAAHWAEQRVRTVHVDGLNYTIKTDDMVQMVNGLLGQEAVNKEHVMWLGDKSAAVVLPDATALQAVLEGAKAQAAASPAPLSVWNMATLPCLGAFRVLPWAEHVQEHADVYGPAAVLEAGGGVHASQQGAAKRARSD